MVHIWFLPLLQTFLFSIFNSPRIVTFASLTEDFPPHRLLLLMNVFCLFFCPPEKKVPSMMRLHLPEESLSYQLKMKNHFSGCLSEPSKNLLDFIQVVCLVPSGREGCKRIPNKLRRHLLVKNPLLSDPDGKHLKTAPGYLLQDAWWKDVFTFKSAHV